MGTEDSIGRCWFTDLKDELKKVGVITPRIFETLKMLLLTATTIARILVDADKPEPP